MKLRYKILLTVILAVVAWAAFGATKPMYKVEDANAFFASLNEDYFMGQLPTPTFNLTNDLVGTDGTDLIANTICFTQKRCVVSINTKYNISWNQTQMSIIHEACHLKLGSTNVKHTDYDDDAHGNDFNNCMVSVANRGGMRSAW